MHMLEAEKYFQVKPEPGSYKPRIIEECFTAFGKELGSLPESELEKIFVNLLIQLNSGKVSSAEVELARREGLWNPAIPITNKALASDILSKKALMLNWVVARIMNSSLVQ